MAVLTGPVSKPIQGLLVGLAGAGLAFALWGLGWLGTWEAKSWDWRAALLAKPGPATSDIVLILLDQNSLDWAAKENGLSWPWPREVYAAIINYCSRNGAKALGFDVLYTEPSKYGVEDDVAMGKAVAEFDKFAVAMFLGQTTGNSNSWPKDLKKPKFEVKGLDRWIETTGAQDAIFPRATFPVSELAEPAATLSNVQLAPDPDGTYRKIRLFGLFDGNVLPTLGLGTFLAAHTDAPLAIDRHGLTVQGQTVPLDGQGRAILRYRGPSGTHRNFSAGAVLQSEIQFLMGETPNIRDKDAFRGKYVLFGFSAPGLFDLRSSPVDGVYTGVEIHATVLDNFLSGDFIDRTPRWLTVGIVLGSALACGLLAAVFTNPMGTVAAGGVFLALPVLLCFLSYIEGYWLPLAVQETAVVLTMVIALVVNYATEGRQKRFIKNAFKQYLSPAVIDQLIQHPDRLKLGGERRTLSIFFSDLEGFTAISEGLTPEALTTLLNTFLSAMTDIIHEQGGTVDKYEGDAIIAFWNAPLKVPDHAVRIVRASLECQRKLADMGPDFRNRTGKDMRMRIGVNTGPAVVGNMGSRNRFDYTMLGDAVNLAARLEGANKQFGTYTMISESTRDLIGNEFAVRELGRVVVVGRREPVTVFEPMFSEVYENDRERLAIFDKGLQLFYRGAFEAAMETFSAIRDQDPAAAAYMEKCRDMQISQPKPWTGVWTLTTK